MIGRQWKTEVLNGTVYSATVNTFNARDQVTLVRQWAGPENGGGAYQDTTMSYDGYGRLQSKHVPEQRDQTGNPTYTTFAYNLDDTIQSATDARGASATYGYNNGRHLVSSVTYTAPTGIRTTSAVNYGYDAAGNRLWMTDGYGRTDYSYDQLSRLKDETRTFAVPAGGLAYQRPAFNNSFKLAYEYNLAGELKSITDSSSTDLNYHGSTVSYIYDSSGRLHDVNGSGYANVSTYASGITYRAWGAVKSFSYGNGLTFERRYDSRLRTTQYTVGGRTPNQQNGYAGPTVMKSDFYYYDDNRLKYSQDNVDGKFDTAYTYDWTNALVEAYSGSQAYDFFHGTNSGTPNGAYRQTYAHDAWNNLTSRVGNYWGNADNYSAGYNAQNRNVAWYYDAQGNVTADETRGYTIDAADRVVDQTDENESEMTQIFDGDGHRLGKYQGYWSRPSYYAQRDLYFVYSSVLGRNIAEVGSDGISNGIEIKGYVYANGEVIAEQVGGYAPVEWVHHNPLTGSYQTTDQDQWSRPQANFDPQGIDAGFEPPQPNGAVLIDPSEKGFWTLASLFPQHHCYLDGLETGACAMLSEMFKSGAAEPDPKMSFSSTGIGAGRYDYVEAWENYSDGSQPYQLEDGTWVVPALRSRDVGRFVWLPEPGPQNSGFKLYGPGFTDKQMGILVDTLSRVKENDCKNFINETLAKYKVGKESNSLDKLLNRATLGYYDVNADYTNTDLGVDIHSTILLRDAFVNRGASAAGVGTHIFLSDTVFERSSSIIPIQSWNRIADTPSYIVHELFHVAGIDKSIIDSQQMTDAIRKNCGLLGSDRIIIRH